MVPFENNKNDNHAKTNLITSYAPVMGDTTQTTM